MRRRSRRPDGALISGFEFRTPPAGSLDPLGLSLLRRSLIRSPVLREVEDRRLFTPARVRTAAPIFSRSSTRLVSPQAATRGGFPSARVGFAVPRDVAICVRRKQRKEVLHASKFGGKGAGGVSRRRRRNEFSYVDC